MFTQQHYIAVVARALASVKPDLGGEEIVQWYNTVHCLVKMFEQDNPAFNQDKFKTACGVPNPVMEVESIWKDD